MTIAILCSGQAHQGVDMFALTAEAAVARPLFELAATLLDGHDPRQLVCEADSATLHRNRTGQILCVLQALAASAALADALPGGGIIAGYSVGELAAWGVAGVIAPGDVLRLAARRAELMDASSHPGDGLLAIRGLDDASIERLAARYGAAIAIINPGGVILGGTGDALAALAVDAAALGEARITRLPVAVASHTPRLAEAAALFRGELASVKVEAAVLRNHRLMRGIDGQAVFDVELGLDKLAAQISQTVRWNACLQSCLEAGATAFLELGPGRALGEMAAAALSIPSRSIDEFATIDGVRTWMKTR